MSLFRHKSPVSQQPTVLHTLRVQTSAYGQGMPIVYGQNRIPGKLIWYGDFTPIAQTSKQASGGKGFGGGTTKTTSYTYTAAVAIALCEGPIAQLCNVWDTKGTLLLRGSQSRSRMFIQFPIRTRMDSRFSSLRSRCSPVRDRRLRGPI